MIHVVINSPHLNHRLRLTEVSRFVSFSNRINHQTGRTKFKFGAKISRFWALSGCFGENLLTIPLDLQSRPVNERRS